MTAGVPRAVENAANDDGGGTMAGAGNVLLRDVPVRVFLQSQDHQLDLIRELQLMDIGNRKSLGVVPRQLAQLIENILTAYADVRSTTRQQAEDALRRGDESVDLLVPILPGMVEALQEWLRLLEEADRWCDEGALLTLAAPVDVRALRRWYVGEVLSQLGG